MGSACGNHVVREGSSNCDPLRVPLPLYPPPPPRVQRMPCPTNTSVRTIIFWDLNLLYKGRSSTFSGPEQFKFSTGGSTLGSGLEKVGTPSFSTLKRN